MRNGAPRRARNAAPNRATIRARSPAAKRDGNHDRIGLSEPSVPLRGPPRVKRPRSARWSENPSDHGSALHVPNGASDPLNALNALRARNEASRAHGQNVPRRVLQPAAPQPDPEPVEDVEEGELGPVGEFIAGILERMKLREVAITETETDDGDIIITLAGKSITALADREPRLAAALSHLAHRAAEMLVDEEAAARVDIKGTRRPQQEDGGSERSGRDSRRDGRRPERGDSRRDSDERDIDEVALERMAREGAEIVRRTGEPELLRPMNSRERWVVHNSLKDERGVRSESEGEGPRKRVRITPA